MTLLGVALLALAAAVAALLGPLLLGRDTTSRRRVLGLADAFAAGMMLGIGYPLMSAALERTAAGAAAGAALGIVATYAIHYRLGIGGAPGPGEHSLTAAAVHAAPEGLALGAAAALDPRLAIVLAATLALHNISESAVLAAHLPVGASGRVRAAGLGVLSNAPQVVVAVVSLALARWAAVLVPPLLGAAFGALTYLCFAELLPDSYGLTGRTSIAVVVTVAAGVVAVASGRIG
jgi:zinc transporter ZupT